jgi:hypothetical protein
LLVGLSNSSQLGQSFFMGSFRWFYELHGTFTL